MNSSRRINFVTPPTSHNTTYLTTLSVSTCPGDFNPETSACIKLIDAPQNPNIFFTTKNNLEDWQNEYYCKLLPNTQYYFNFVNKQFPYSLDDPRCKNLDHSRCAIFFSEGAD